MRADQEPAGGVAQRAPVCGLGGGFTCAPCCGGAEKPDWVALGWGCRAVAAAEGQLDRAGSLWKRFQLNLRAAGSSAMGVGSHRTHLAHP